VKKVRPKTIKWLKGLHIFFSSAWVGAVLSMMAIVFLRPDATDAGELYAFHATMKLIDDAVIIAAALGCFVSGAVLSWLTQWGFFRYYWIAVKLFVTIALIISGTIWLGPWVNAMTDIAREQGLLALQNDQYLFYRQMHTILGTLQACLVIAMAFISTLKPWGKRAG